MDKKDFIKEHQRIIRAWVRRKSYPGRGLPLAKHYNIRNTAIILLFFLQKILNQEITVF